MCPPDGHSVYPQVYERTGSTTVFKTPHNFTQCQTFVQPLLELDRCSLGGGSSSEDGGRRCFPPKGFLGSGDGLTRFRFLRFSLSTFLSFFLRSFSGLQRGAAFSVSSLVSRLPVLRS